MKYVVLFTVFLYSCTQTSNTPDGVVVLTDNISEEVTLNDLFHEIECIALETSEYSIFGKINKLIVYDKRYYILDHQTKKIFVFQTDGTFIKTIGKIGDGPGEYTHIEDFVIDKENKKLVILGYPSIVYVYDLDGNYILQKKIMSSPVWKICSYENGFICSNNHQSFTQKEEPLIYLFDKEFNLTNKMKEAKANIYLPPFISDPFLMDGNKIAYFDNFNSIIYFIDPSNPDDSESLSFVFQNPIPLELLSNANVEEFFENQRKYSFFTNAFLANNVLWTTFANNGTQCVHVRDLKNKKQKTAKHNSWYPTIMCEADGYFYGCINVSFLLGENNPIANAKMGTQYPIDYNSNPAIIRFKPKEIFK